jgi:hypothetical protein
VNDEKAGYVSFDDEAREIRYQLIDLIFTAPGQSLNDQMPDSLLTVCDRLRSDHSAQKMKPRVYTQQIGRS